MKVRQVLETCIYTNRLEESEDFYSTILGLELVAKDPGRHLFFRCGNSMVLIFNPAVTTIPSGEVEVPPHGATGQCHLAFSMEAEEIEDWRDCLRRNQIEIEKEINWPEGGFSIYFRDPAGNCLEFATRELWKL